MVRLVMAWVRFAFGAAWGLLGWLYVVLCCTFFFADFKTLRWEGDGMLVTAEWRAWFAKIYRYSTTLGRGIVFYPGARDAKDALDDRVERHERVHVWQMEDISLRFLLVGLCVTACTGDWVLGLCLWLSAPIWMITNYGTALLRFSHNAEWPKEGKWYKKPLSFLRHLFVDIAYRDSEHERSAYAQTAMWPGGESWWQCRERQRAHMTGESPEDHERPM